MKHIKPYGSINESVKKPNLTDMLDALKVAQIEIKDSVVADAHTDAEVNITDELSIQVVPYERIYVLLKWDGTTMEQLGEFKTPEDLIVELKKKLGKK